MIKPALFIVFLIGFLNHLSIGRDLYAPYVSFPDTIYLDENFNMDWGSSINGNNEALNVEVSFFLSMDKELDENDVLFATHIKNIEENTGYYGKRLYDAIIASNTFPTGKRYILMHLDPDNKISETNINNNIRPYEVYLFSRESDVSWLGNLVGRQKNSDSTLVFDTEVLNSGNTDITSYSYTIRIANSEADLSSPLLEYTTLDDKGIVLPERTTSSQITKDISGIGINTSSFVVQWELHDVYPSDLDNTNNTELIELNWNNLQEVNNAAEILLMTNRNDTIETCDAIIYDDGGPFENYSHNINSTLTIKPSVPGEIITLTLDKNFGLFAFDDALSFFDPGQSESAPVEKLYHVHSGSSYTFYSTAEAGSLVVDFKTNSSNNNIGFKITAQCLDTNTLVKIPTTGNKQITSCNERIFDSGGIKNYENNSDGSVTIFPEEEGQAVEITFNEFHTERNYDFVRIYDGPTTGDAELAELTGTSSPGTYTASSLNGALTIAFTSDNSQTAGGFSFASTCRTRDFFKLANHQKVYTCDTVLFDNGVFGDYLNNSYATATIFPSDSTYPIELSFESFDLEEGMDFLNIYSGTDSSMSLLASYSGTMLPEKVTSQDSITGAITLEFISNGENVGSGFKINTGCRTLMHNMAYKETETISTCDMRIYDNGGRDGNHEAGSNDILIIEPDEAGQQLVLNFEEFDLYNDFTTLKVYEGKGISGDFLKLYTGNTIPETLIAPLGAEALTLHFTSPSDASYNRSGYKLDVGCQVPQFLKVPVTGSDTVYACDTTIYDNGGPGNYLPNSNGRLIIYPADPEKVIELTIKSLNTIDESLNIYQGSSTRGMLAGSYSRISSPVLLTSGNTDGAFTLEFSSNEAWNGFGFEISAICVVPEVTMTDDLYDKEIHTCNTTIYDHGGPNADYPQDIRSSLFVYPSIEGAIVEITVESLDLGLDVWGNYSRLAIFDEPITAGVPDYSIYPEDKIVGNTYKSTNPEGMLALLFRSDNVAPGYALKVSCDMSNVKWEECTTVSGTDTRTECNEFTWIDGNTYTSSNNTATYNIVGGAANGCDSLVTLDLTIINSATGTDIRTECNKYTWIDGNTYTSSNNSATYNIVGGAANGCDSLVTLDLTINNVSDLTTDLNGTTISSNNSNATFQWLDCGNNYSIIQGQNSQSITASENGNYAVEITENGCVDTTACEAILTVGNIVSNFADEIMVYPNPTNGNFSVGLPSSYESVLISIYNIHGRLIQTKSFEQTELIYLSIEEPAGVYLIQIQTGDNKAVIEVIKE